MKRKNWYPLDNAAKLYPAVSNARRPYQFFFSALMAEEVKKESLELAVNRILARVPTFRTRLKKGIFWYYLEENKLPFPVREEPADFRLLPRQQDHAGVFSRAFRRRRGDVRLSGNSL